MDPALWELLEDEAQDEVQVIIRLRNPEEVPAGVRVVTRFGPIVTCRLKREAIRETWSEEAVASLKAPRLIAPDDPEPPPDAERSPADYYAQAEEDRRPPGLDETGRGVLVGVLDWGADVAHPNFRNADGTTRLEALWDQRGPASGPGNRYGYGTIHTADAINAALATDDPYETLGYHPGDADPSGRGAHGTHVLDIAAGNGRAGPPGVAPEAALAFVHLSTPGTHGLANLGHSVSLLEAVDFIRTLAGDRPFVINTSLGRHGGPRDGSTLAEQGFDALLVEAPGRAIINSTGNYFDRRTHTFGQVQPGKQQALVFHVDDADVTPNELEVWYPGDDTFAVELETPDGTVYGPVSLGDRITIAGAEGREVGRLYHRASDPNNGDHHIDLFLLPDARPGRWTMTLLGEDVVDGRYHASIERDSTRPGAQSEFSGDHARTMSTTGTVCNGFRTIAVGAYDSHTRDRPMGRFSSSGPTRDGRQKPEIVAPGVRVLAARSAPRDAVPAATPVTLKDGTSMAAPHVAGAVALMFEAAGRRLPIDETRRLLLSTAESVETTPAEAARLGNGFLDIERAVRAARGHPEPADDQGDAVHAIEPTVTTPLLTPTNGALPPAEAATAPPAPGGTPLDVHQETMTDYYYARPDEDDFIGIEDDYAYDEDDEDLAIDDDFEEDDFEEDIIDDFDEDIADDYDDALDDVYAGDYEQEAEHIVDEEDDDDFDDAFDDEDFDDDFEDDFDDEDFEEDFDDEDVDDAYDEDDVAIEVYDAALNTVAQADEAIAAGAMARHPGAVLHALLTDTIDAVPPFGSGEALSPAAVFDAFAPGGAEALRRHFAQFFDVVALPGSAVEATALSPGDVLLRRALGESHLAHAALLADGTVFAADELLAAGLAPESGHDGLFVQVVETGAMPHTRRERFARRLTDSDRRLPRDQMIVRRRQRQRPLPTRLPPARARRRFRDRPDARYHEEAYTEASFVDLDVGIAPGADTEVDFAEPLPAIETVFPNVTFDTIREFVRVPVTLEAFAGPVFSRTRALTAFRDIATLRALPQEHVQEVSANTFDVYRLGEALMDSGYFQPDPSNAARFRIPMDAVICHPADPADPNKLPPGSERFPVVLIVHGQHESIQFTGTNTGRTVTQGSNTFRETTATGIASDVPNHDGYRYLQSELARNGIVSISISTNPANVLNALLRMRADTVLEGLNVLNRLNRSTSRYRRRLDLRKAGIIGHSRGGDAVVEAALLRRRRGLGFGVKAVVSLAPTDFTGTLRRSNRLKLNRSTRLNYLVVYGSHDNDVSGLGEVIGSGTPPPRDSGVRSFTGTGFRHYDRTGCPRSMIFIHGATHNRFNTQWLDNQELAASDLADPRLTSRADQQTLTTEYVGGWMRMVLNGEASFEGLFNGSAPNSLGRTVSIQWKRGSRDRIIDNYDRATPVGRNDLGGRVTAPAFVQEVDMTLQDPQIPHLDRSLRAEVTATSSGIYRSEIPGSKRNFGQFDLLTFRMTKLYNVGVANQAALDAQTLPRFTVRLIDRSGTVAVVDSATIYAANLQAPNRPYLRIHSTNENITKSNMETLAVPVAAFSGINLGNIRALEVAFDPAQPDVIFFDTFCLLKL